MTVYVLLRPSVRVLCSVQLTRRTPNIRYYVSSAGIKSGKQSVSQPTNETSPIANVVQTLVVSQSTTGANFQNLLEKTNLDESTAKNNNHVKRRPWLPISYNEQRHFLNQYKKLSKFRLTALVVITAMGGYAMAPAPFDLTTFCFCTIGTGLVSAAANAINQYHEVPFDSQMLRTKSRVLVTGRLTPLHAISFAVVAGTTGLSMLFFGVNGLAAGLGLGNLFLYTSIYTPMKRMTILNTWVGSVVGAIPPLMGWAGCAGSLDAGAWILAGILYSWQFPHFNALSWNLRPDYSRAGYRMMAVTNPGLCRRTALRNTITIAGLSFLAPVVDVTNAWFALETLPLNAYFCWLAFKFYRKSDSKSSRTLFRFSLLHLPALVLLLLLNKKHWYFTDFSGETTNALVECSRKNLELKTLETSQLA